MSRISLLVALVVVVVAPLPAAGQLVDLYGDPLPKGAVARLGTVRFRIPGDAWAIEFAPDGKTLVTTGGDGLLVWDVSTGRTIRRLANEEGQSFGRGFLSPDHRFVTVVQSDPRTRTGKIRLFEVATGKHVRDFGTQIYAALQFSPDGQRLAAYHTNFGRGPREDMIDIFNVSNGSVVSDWKAEQDGVIHAIFTKDGKQLVTGGADATVRFWDVQTGNELRRLAGSSGPIGYLALSADEKLLAGIHQQATPPNQAPRHPPRSLPWYGENRIQVWNLETGKTLYEFVVERPEKKTGVTGITSAAFTPDGKRLLSGGIDRKTRVWDLEKGIEVRRFDISSDWGAALSPDGRTLAAYDGSCIRLLDLQAGKELLSEFDPHIFVPRAHMMPDGRTVVTAGRREGLLDLWDATAGRRTGQLASGSPEISYWLVPSEDGRKLVNMSYPEGRVFLWDLEKRVAPQEVRVTESKVLPSALLAGVGSIALAGDGKTLAIGHYSDPKVVVLDAENGNVLRELPNHTDGTRHVFFTGGGKRLIVGCGDHTFRVWELESNKEPRQFGPFGDTRLLGGPVGVGGPAHASYTATLAADGRVLAYGNQNGFIALVEVETGRKLFRIETRSRRPQFIPTLSFNPNGHELAWSDWSDPSIHLLETATGKERQYLLGHAGRVHTLSFSNDGRRLVSAGSDSTGLVWDMLGTQAQELTDARVDQAWRDLASEDAPRAWEAIRLMTATRERTVQRMSTELRAAPPVDPGKLAEHITALNSDQFAEREKAVAELEKLGDAAGPALDKLLKGTPSPEARRRAEAIVAKLGGPVTSPEVLRTLRAIEALEHIGTPGAMQVIERLAKGAAGARETEDAKRALERLKKRKR